MPTWLTQLISILSHLDGKSPACLLTILVTCSGGYYWSTATFASVKTVEQQSEQFGGGIDLILVRLDVTDAEGKLTRVSGEIRTKDEQLADMEDVLEAMEPASVPASIMRENIRALRLDVAELRRQQSNFNQALLNAEALLAEAEKRRAP